MSQHPGRSRRQASLVCAALLSLQMQAHAVDIANAPLANQASASVRANMMFIMDDSGSMDRDYVPDGASYSNLCRGYHVTNAIFYNPALTYLAPMQANGTRFPNASFNAAYDDGYAQSGTTTNLNTLNNLSTPSTRVGTNGSGNAINSRFYYATYTAANPATPVCSGAQYDWTKWSIVTNLPAGQQTNYANWYSYYRTRMLAMRGSVGSVLGAIDASRFRIGYSAISNHTGYTSSSTFLPIGDFDQGTQKADFYTKLYGAATSSSTPLRTALDKIGKYYANKQLNGSALPNGVADPVQYSCQRNYAMLTTDGYWNLGDEPNSYTPTQLDGSTAIGNQDGGTTARPMLDDGRQQGGNWVTGGSGVSNSLADISMYYYQTDLRPGAVGSAGCTGSIANQDVCENNVIAVGADTASHQHMTTFSLGLGVAGQLTYRPDYETATSGDFFAIRNGTRAWPNPDVTSASSTVITRADDLWHAAVNGRGRFYAASNPGDLVTGLADALESISSTTGTGSAAATSSLVPVVGDNFEFRALYTTVLWEGNLRALTIDPATGAASATPLWEARNTVKAQTAAASDTRNILYRDTSVGGTQLAAFTYANLNAGGRGSYFSNLCQAGNYRLSQCATLVAQGAAVQAAANDGNNVVNWLRGRSGKEDIVGNPVADRLYRGRVNTPLGDIVNAAPVYVKQPPFRYADAGYSTYAANNATRTGMVYAAANDGMLHAFNATTGAEVWAYVPSPVMPDLWRLADNNYATNHRFYVDGAPVVGDVFDGSSWHTILVGGLGAGGRGYYALDITDPANPRSLWEITSADESSLGLTFGNPIIVKNRAGTWVVAFSSGYNNTGPGDGNGHLYVRNALSGASITTMHTFTAPGVPAGSVATPSGLGKINGWVDTVSNNTAARIYGGDMLGNMWRFDYDDNVAPAGNEAIVLGRALTPAGVPQPITIKPVLSKVGNVSVLPTVAFATGRYIGSSDVGDNTLQSIYVVKDSLAPTGLGILRDDVNMVQQSMAAVTVGGAATRRITPQAVDWSARDGWYVDLALSAGERVNVDMQLASGVLTVATNDPAPTACNPGGTSWLYFFDLGNGSIADAVLMEYMTAGLNLVRLASGRNHVIVSDVRGGRTIREQPQLPPSASTVRRTSWRELVN